MLGEDRVVSRHLGRLSRRTTKETTRAENP
jgi:hypothetical protein